MKSVAIEYQDESRTMAKAMRITRQDDFVFGLTTATRDMRRGGVQYQQSGLDSLSIVTTAGFQVDNTDVQIIPDDDTMTARDLLAGLWDGAEYWVFEYNWTDPTKAVRTLSRGTFGNVTVKRGQFSVELRSRKQKLQQAVGIVTSKTCRARLGDWPSPIPDALCRIDIADYTVTGALTGATSKRVFADSARVEADDWFGEGLIEFTGGANAGLSQKVWAFASGVFTLALPMPFDVEIGDAYTATAGCRKRLAEDCFTKFNNVLNFQAEPHLPGIDALTGGVNSAQAAAPTPAPSPAPAPGPAPAPPAPAPAPAPAGPYTATFTPDTTSEIANPGRGLYDFGPGYVQNYNSGDLGSVYSAGIRLSLALIDLSATRTTAISPAILAAISNGFALLRAAGMKGIVRPVYNYDNSGTDTTLYWAQYHLSQLSPIFNANADVIHVVQAGTIGAYGENHDSTNGLTSAANFLAIRDAYLAAVPVGIDVLFRYPRNVMAWWPTAMTEGQINTGIAQSRIGLYNDCFLAGPNDAYTYDLPSMAAQRSYAQQVSRFTPWGGETCDVGTPLRDGSEILTEGPAYHLNFLNRGFYGPFFTKWAALGIDDDVKRGIGYRLYLDGVNHDPTAAAATTTNVEVLMHNAGWSRVFGRRPVKVWLVNGGTTYSGTGGDLTLFDSQSSTPQSVTVPVVIPAGAPSGAYAVFVSFPDGNASLATNRKYMIRPAVQNAVGQTWDDTLGRMPAGTSITV